MKTAIAGGQHRNQVAQPRTATWAPWAAGVWAVVLAIIFFEYRQSDVAQLPRFAEAFPSAFHGMQFSALRDSGLGLVAGLLTVASWFGFGDLADDLLGRFGQKSSESSSLAWSVATKCAWGAGISSLLMFVVGVTRLYTKTVAAIGLVLGLLLFARAIRRLRISRTNSDGAGVSKLAAVVILIPLLLAAITSLAPPTAKDALLYHISLPKAFLDARGLADVRYNIAQYYALGAELNGTWAMLLGRFVDPRVGEAAFGFTQFAYLPLLLLAIYGWMRHRGCDPRVAIVPVALIAFVPTFWASSTSGYNDCALALYVALAIAAAASWWKTLDRRDAAEVGVAIGFGLCVKLLAVFLAAPLLILFLLRLREAKESPADVSKIVKTVLISAALAAVLAAPWYVRNFVRTGSPVYPFYMNIFHGNAVGWDEQRSVIDQILNARYGGYPKDLVDYAAVPIRVSVAAQPDIPKYFDGVLGISFLFGLPILIVAAIRKRLDAEVVTAAALSCSFAFCWIFTSEQLRYLLPALPALGVAISVAVLKLDKRMRAVLLASAIPGALVIGAWFLQQNPAAVVVGAEPRDTYLERTLDHYRIYETVNSSLPADARVWLINMRRDTYYLERSYFSDFRIEHYTLLNLVDDSSSVEELSQRVHQMGITHILFRADTILDPATSPIYDPRKSQAENDQKLSMVRTFLLDGGVVKKDGNFVLVQVK